jgi:hypothetical protein
VSHATIVIHYSQDIISLRYPSVRIGRCRSPKRSAERPSSGDGRSCLPPAQFAVAKPAVHPPMTHDPWPMSATRQPRPSPPPRRRRRYGTDSTAQHSTAQHSTAQHSTAQHSTAQHSTAQHSTAQHSTAQHSTDDTTEPAPHHTTPDQHGRERGRSSRNSTSKKWGRHNNTRQARHRVAKQKMVTITTIEHFSSIDR